MMVTAAAIGFSAGERFLSSSFSYSDVADKLSCSSDFTFPCSQAASMKSVVTAKKSSNYSSGFLSSGKIHSAKALKEHADIALDTSNTEPWDHRYSELLNESLDDGLDQVEALLLLQKSMLEKQWNLSAENMITYMPDDCKKNHVTCSGTSARRRRIDSRQKIAVRKSPVIRISTSKRGRSIIGTDVLHNRSKGYIKGVVSEELLTHAEVVHLSKKIKLGLHIEEQKSRLKDRLGCEPSVEQLAIALRTSRADLRATIMECSLAREKLTMSNVRLVMSIAQRYDNMGAEMADLIQGGLTGLLRGIEKFDPSKGFKISTYVYWWIRQGVSKTLADNSRMLRLPNHIHERLSLIRKAKKKLEEKGITPTTETIAESLNMSQKKVQNATAAISMLFSLDREVFPSLDGPGETHHSYIADNHLENNPWHGVDEWSLKEEVKNLIRATLREREGEIIRLYYGLDNECLTWEDISRRLGLSRERVRKVGLVALEKLKHAARRKKLEAMLIQQ